MKKLSNPITHKANSADEFFEHCALVIETNKYAGNFERQMGAYVTGYLDMTDVGDEEAKLAKHEIPKTVSHQLEDLVLNHLHESGDAIVASPYSTTGNRNNGEGSAVVIYFNKIPNQRLLKIMQERARKYAGKHKHDYEGKNILRILGFRLQEVRISTKEWYLDD